MDKSFLNMLRCPISGLALAPADDELLRRATEAQVSGELRDRQGLEVDAFETGLVDAEGRWFYPVRNNIPTLIPDQAIAVSDLPTTTSDDA